MGDVRAAGLRRRRRRRGDGREAVDLTVPFVVIFTVAAAAAGGAAAAAAAASDAAAGFPPRSGAPGGGRLYHSQFAVLVPHGREAADRLAARHGFANLGQIGDLENYYLLERGDGDPRRGKREARPDVDAARELADEPEVEWFEQQKERRRVKRDGHRIASRGRLEKVGPVGWGVGALGAEAEGGGGREGACGEGGGGSPPSQLVVMAGTEIVPTAQPAFPFGNESIFRLLLPPLLTTRARLEGKVTRYRSEVKFEQLRLEPLEDITSL